MLYGTKVGKSPAKRRAQFRWIADLTFAPDGTLYIHEEHLIRKLDRAGQVTTWAF